MDLQAMGVEAEIVETFKSFNRCASFKPFKSQESFQAI